MTISIIDAVKFNRGLPGQTKAWQYLESNLPEDIREEFAKLYRDNPSAPQEKDPLAGQIFLYLELTGKWDTTGHRVLRLSLYNGSKCVDKLPARSGQSHAQGLVHPTEDYSGSMRIIPEGIYDIGAIDDLGYDPGSSDGFGRWFVPVVDRHRSNNRSAFGIHSDRNYAISPGSAGCPVVYTESDMFRVIGWLSAKARPKYLIVNLGLGFLDAKGILYPGSKKN